LVIALGVLVCAAIAPGGLRLRLRTDGNALIPLDAPEIAVDGAVRDKFKLQDPVVVVVWSHSPEGIFNPHTLALVAGLTKEFKKLDGVDPDQVLSLATEYGDRVFPGTLNFRRLLEPAPGTAEECQKLRDDLRVYRLYTGMLVSRDEKGAAILVGAAPGILRVELFDRLKQLLAARELVDEEVSVIGAPVAEALLGTHLLQDLGVPNALLGLHQNEQAGESNGILDAYGLRIWVARHIGLVPVALLVMALVFYVYFGSLAAVILPLTEVGACLIVVFALMGWLGVPIYLTIAVMPIILTAAGVTDEIHVFARYRDRLREHPDADHRVVLLDTLSEIGRPVIMAGITTGIGFLAFVFSPIAPVRAFGVFTAIGLAFCMAWSLTVIPASLSLIDPLRITARRLRSGFGAETGPQRFFAWLGRGVIRFRVAVLIGAVALAALTPFGIAKVVVQDSWIDGFAPESEFRQATNHFNEQFHGGHTLLVNVDTGSERIEGEIDAAALDGMWTKIDAGTVPDSKSLIGWRLRLHRTDSPLPSDSTLARQHAILNTWTTWVTDAKKEGDLLWLKGIPSHGIAKFGLRLNDGDRVRYELTPSRLMQPETMHRIADLETFIESHAEQAVGGVMGTADYLETVNFLRRGRKDEHRGIPAGVEEIDWLWREYTRMRGDRRIGQLIDADFGQSILNVFLRDANFVDTGDLMADIREYERENLASHGIRLSFAGDVAVSQTLIEAIVGTQVISVVAALAGDLAVTVILGRSLGFGILCVIPSLLAVLLNFAVMGWMGIPLGVATSMFSSMTLGMGVDYAIHFLQSYRQHRTGSLNRSASEPSPLPGGTQGGEDARSSGALRILSAPPSPYPLPEREGNFARQVGGEVDRVSAVIEAARTTGPPILVNTLAVTLGFGVLLLSQVPANARLGGLLVLSLFNCFAVTLVVLPAILAVKGSRRNANPA
jgi:predicted RND superfamily exporter protein